MAFTDAERVQIRRWMGGSFLFINIDQRLESAIDTVENLPETPTGQTEAYIRDTLLVRLDAAFTELSKLESKLLALNIDEVKVDPVRAVASLRSVGRTYSQQLAHSLGFNSVLRDAWAMGSPDPTQQLGLVHGHHGTQ